MGLARKNLSKKDIGGFTLLELLIVVSIIAILSVALVLVLNPAEALRKTRDSNRISDLSTMKTALGLYLTSTSTPYLGGLTSNAACKTIPSTVRGTAGTFKIWYSTATTITDLTLDGSTTATPAAAASASPALTNGTGWIPVNFDTLIGGSPISNIPVDPTNTVADAANVASTDLVYRYSCSQTPLTFVIASQLESEAFTTAPDNKRTSDGGNNANYYEVGTNLRIFGTAADF